MKVNGDHDSRVSIFFTLRSSVSDTIILYGFRSIMMLSGTSFSELDRPWSPSTFTVLRRAVLTFIKNFLLSSTEERKHMGGE